MTSRFRIDVTLIKLAIVSMCFVGAQPQSAFSQASDEETFSREFALSGYCPVSYFTEGGPTKGDANLKAEHLGHTYLLSNKQALEQFKKAPDRYVPQFAGLCTVALGGMYGNKFYSNPTVYYVRDGKLYMFSSMRARNAYDRKPQDYIDGCAERFIAAKGYCPVAYQRDGKAVKGKPSLLVSYGYQGFCFSDDVAKAAFLKDPDRYIVQFDGYCAHAISRGQKHPGDANAFAIIDNKTYLFWDNETKSKFLAEKDSRLPLAIENWSGLREETGVREAPPSRPRKRR